jgi:carbamoyltransferase
MIVLGAVDIKKPTHDNSIVILKDGEIVFAEAGERVSRIKHDDNLPVETFENALRYTSISNNVIDYIAVASPDPKFSTLLFARNYGFDSLRYALHLFVSSPLLFLSDVVDRLKKMISKGYSQKTAGINKFNLKRNRIVKICHQTCHAAAAYYGSGFKGKCLTISLDGCGPRKDGKIISGAVFICENGRMKKVEEVPPYASLGGLYAVVTEVLGLKAGDGEFKTMGLAAYGNPDKCYEEIDRLHPYFKNGVWHGNKYWPDYYSVMNKNIFKQTRIYRIINNLRKKNKDEDIAASMQKVFETRVIEFFEYLSKKYKIKRFACSGGIFLNIVLNRKLLEKKFCQGLYIYPNAGDSGISLGAAYCLYFKKTKKIPGKIKTLYLGTGFKESDYIKVMNKFKDRICFRKAINIAKLTAKKLTQGKVIGWFQGRAEWGPRALGNRSVLADPRYEKTKDRINKKLKARDWFMPFGPSMMDEYKEKYLKLIRDKIYFTDYMLFSFEVKKGMNKFPAAIHVDNTARPQIVKKKINPLYHQVINEFYKLTGLPVILNTSFNKHGLPIVHSPEDAVNHLLWGCLDSLVLGNYYIERK